MDKKPELAGSRTPSLKALRSFEAAARHLSLTAAAAELNVSVAAVAFQVRQVEEVLGVKLLSRSGRGLVPTADGAALAAGLGEPFRCIAQAVANARAPDLEPRTVTVSMLGNFAALWLLPRLAEFRTLHPGIAIRVVTGERRTDFVSDGVDCAIRCGPGEWPVTSSSVLFPQRLAPLCVRGHPAAERGGVRWSEVADANLLVNTSRETEWQDWFDFAGVARRQPLNGQELFGRELVAKAVYSGLGIGLMDVSVFAAQIEKGELVRLGPARDTGWRHCIVRPADRGSDGACQAFVDWLRETAANAGRRAPPLRAA